MKTKFDFAFSFAGEDRALVAEIADGLKEYDIFYDEEYTSELLGQDLYHYLRDLYMNKAKYVVCFLSQHYKKKVWTSVEFSAIKERFMGTFFASDFLIPIILEDDVWISDIPSFIGYINHKNIGETVAQLKSKYQQALNEDLYLENINLFNEHLLEKLESLLRIKGIYAEKKKTTLIIIRNGEEKYISILPETFSKLPCLIMYEDKVCEIPSALITWKQKNIIQFSINFFTRILNNKFEDISLNELIIEIVKYISCDKR